MENYEKYKYFFMENGILSRAMDKINKCFDIHNLSIYSQNNI